MIPYEDLLNALVDWRARQGLPPLHNLDYLGELRQNRIDTSSAIAAVTGSLEVSDLEEAGADYDDPLADPPYSAGADEPWSVDSGEYANAEEVDDPFAEVAEEYPADNYAADSYSVDGYGEAGGFTVDEEIPMDSEVPIVEEAVELPVSASSVESYEYDDMDEQTAYTVGDSTAMFQELAPAQSAQPDQYDAAAYQQQDGYARPGSGGEYNYDPSAYGASDVVAPGAGQATAMYDTSLAANAAVAVEADPYSGAQVPNAGAATAMYDTSLATDAAGAVEGMAPAGQNAGAATAMYDTNLVNQTAANTGYEYDGGVPSEPVYDSMAAQAEYQAERLAEQQAQDAYAQQGYDPNQSYGAGNYDERADSQAGGYAYDANAQQAYDPNAQAHDPNAYQQPTEPPPLEPPPGGDFAFPFPGDDDDFGST